MEAARRSAHEAAAGMGHGVSETLENLQLLLLIKP
jgi:hypothetical protein